MKKKAKVHRLPTDRAEKCVTIAHKQMMLSPGLVTSGGDIQAYHLYILSDEEIKEGDKLYSNGDIFEATKEIVDKIMPDGYVLGMYPKKMIATTDTEMHINKIVEEDMHMYKESLPQIPESIIKAYVEKPFDKVMVEYEERCIDDNCDGSGKCGPCLITKNVPKLNQDGTLAVSLVEEEMYSRDEVGRKIKEFVKEYAYEWDMDDIDEWIKENL